MTEDCKSRLRPEKSLRWNLQISGRLVSKLMLTPGQVLSPEESQRLGFPPGAGLVLSTGEMLSREACQSMGLPPGSVILAVGAPPQPKPQHLGTGPDVRGQQQGQNDQPDTPTLGLNVGAGVEIHALQKRPELNGKCGKIVKRQDDGRLQVKTTTAFNV